MICSEWITETDLAVCNCSTSDPVLVANAIQASSEILYQLTGLQFPGTCEQVVRPCANSANPYGFNWTTWNFPWIPLRIGGSWINTGPCGCHMARCDCTTYPRVYLGRDDVQTVTEVTIDGDVLDPSAYRLDENQYLVRTDGSTWPCCQNLGSDLGETGTWGIELTYGWPVPQALQNAAASLAAEFINACTEGATCRLPPRTQQIVKQGTSITMAGVLSEIEQGLTGLTDVDMAIQAFNPNRLQRSPAVWSPEVGFRGLRS